MQKGASNGPKLEKIRSVALHVSRTIHYMTFVNVCKMISPGVFSFFLVFWVVRGVKRQKLVQNDKNSVCRAPFSGSIHHMIVVCGTQV